MWKVREIADKVTNVVMNYTEIEAKVREATNDDHWGPTGAIRHELSQATFSYDYFPEVMGMLWKRIAENKKNPRRIYKSLVLLHHLLLNGSDRVVRSTQDRIYELRSLQDYHVIYEPGFNLNTIIPAQEFKDGEMNVRLKAKEIVELVQDEDRLKEERKRSKRNRDKYVGISSDRSMMSGLGGGSGGGGGRWRDDDEDEDFNNRSSSSKYSPPFTRSTNHTSKSTFSDSSPSKNSSSSPDGPTDADDDFNPRAAEFGDFKSAPSPTPTATGNKIGAVKLPTSAVKSSSPAAPVEFADFQSAFSSGTTSPTAGVGTGATTTNNSGSADLLGIMDHNTLIGATSPASVPAPAPTPVVGSFGGFQAAFPPPQQLPAGTTVSPSVDLFNNHVPTVPGVPVVVPMMTQQQPSPQLFPQQQQQQSLPNLLDNLDLSGNAGMPLSFAPGLNSTGVGGGDAVLKPQSANAANNHINNNNNGTETQDGGKASLKGTTWSDLPLSLADVNLSKGPKVAPPKPSMRQMSFGSN